MNMAARSAARVRRPRVPAALFLSVFLLLPGLKAYSQGLGETSPQEVEERFSAASKLSEAEKVRETSQRLEEMKTTLQRGFEILAEAREEKDIVRMNCVNEKLSAQKGLLKISEQAHVQLQEAVARGDQAATNHEFTKISIAHQKMRGLGIEIEGCAGEALRYAGETKVTVEVSGDIGADDPTLAPDVDPLLDDHPESASPFQ